MTHTAHAYVADENILELPCAYACAYLTSENQALVFVLEQFVVTHDLTV